RPVDQARSQGLPLGGAPFALEIAARNSPRGEGLFLIMDGERKEILPRLRLLGRDDRRQHSGFAPGGEHRAIRLAGDVSGLEGELAPAPVEFFALNVKHLSSSCIGLRMRKPAAHAARGSGLVIGKTARGWEIRQPLAILP